MTTHTIKSLHAAGLGVCCLTKGGLRSFQDIDLLNPKTDAFATTLISMDDSFSSKWEPGASSATDRVASLKAHHHKGIFTWVSLEPTISAEESIRVIRETHEFVDLYKVGKANYIALAKTIDWEDYTHRVIKLMAELNQKHYIKKDLQCYLPRNYYNPLRIKQHF
jgi:DNA repair photolyase